MLVIGPAACGVIGNVVKENPEFTVQVWNRWGTAVYIAIGNGYGPRGDKSEYDWGWCRDR